MNSPLLDKSLDFATSIGANINEAVYGNSKGIIMFIKAVCI